MKTIGDKAGLRKRNRQRRFGLELRIREMLIRSPEPCFLLTATFGENLLDHKEAVRRWKLLVQRIERLHPGWRFVGVWARQKRGAWHVHGIFEGRLCWKMLHRMATETGWGRMINVEQLGVGKWFVRKHDNEVPNWAEDAEFVAKKVARYLSGYLTGNNALDPELDKGVRRTIVIGKLARVCTMRFDWARGVGALWKAGLAVHREFEPGYRWFKRRTDDFDYLVRLGWESLSEASRRILLDGSETEWPCWAIRRWWFKGEDPVYPF
jgi:hypothetical protein